jgi:hypothetical protein
MVLFFFWDRIDFRWREEQDGGCASSHLISSSQSAPSAVEAWWRYMVMMGESVHNLLRSQRLIIALIVQLLFVLAFPQLSA